MSPLAADTGFRLIADPHLRALEDEAVSIIREVTAECQSPVLLFSAGKDSVVLLHLAMAAFAPARLPFPVLHIDTGHNFPEVIAYRDRTVAAFGLELLVASVQDSIDAGRVVDETGPGASRNRLQSVTLLDAIALHRIDAAFGGGRRDEDKARAKERFVSFRDVRGAWEPRAQRPEPWGVVNTALGRGEHLRAFPLSNWTEADIWTYIHLENIPLVPLYFAKPRPVVQRDGALIVVDDERMPLREGEQPRLERVRFRTLGCYPLTAAQHSEATTVPEVIAELLASRESERSGRLVDSDQVASMERKKAEGYF